MYQQQYVEHDRLLSIGGKMDSGVPTTAVYMYNPTTNSWEIFSHMIAGRYRCFTAVLPDNQLVIVGGTRKTDHDDAGTDIVEIASIILS